MRYLLLFICILFVAGSAGAQIYIAGDTTGRHFYNPEYAFGGGVAILDVDCDDSVDLRFDSHSGSGFQNDWSRLSFYMSGGTEVLNSNVGALTLFHKGDTIPVTDSLWTPWLDFIWGVGGMGPYGTIQIDTAWVAFRKANAGDTTYLFLNISTNGTWMKIHQISSQCAANPLTEVSAIHEISDNGKLNIYPNLFQSMLTIPLTGVFKASLFNLQGQLIMQWQNLPSVNTENLFCGMYLLKVETPDENAVTVRVSKQ